MITREDIRSLVASRVESDEPDRVLTVLRKHEGKQLTRRILPQLPGGSERWRIRTAHGMAHLETWDYTRSNGNVGFSILVAYAEKNVTIDCNAIVSKYAVCYFGAKDERNAKRLMCANDATALENCAAAVNAVLAAREALRIAEERLELYVGHDEPFSADRYQILDLVKGDDK